MDGRIRECIQMLCELKDSLVPCDYVGNDSAILDGIKIESADFVLTSAIEILNKSEYIKVGHWVNDIFCSECNRFPVDVSVSISNRELTKYFSRCPHCGAKMKGGVI